MRLSPELSVLIGTALGASTNLLTWRARNRKSDADSARVDIQSAIDLTNAYRAAMEDFGQQLVALRAEYAKERDAWREENAKLRERIAVLEAKIVLGGA